MPALPWRQKGSAGVPPAMRVTMPSDPPLPRSSAPASGFFLDPDAPIARHRHNLPHWLQGQVWQFITWRLADSLPQAKLAEWEAVRAAWLNGHPKPWSEPVAREYHRRFSSQVDDWLDAGQGACILRQSECREVVVRALWHFAGDRYELGAFVVMPNHVHVLCRPRAGHSLAAAVHSWKSFTAKRINDILGASGAVWQEDYWDRLIRHEAHWLACWRYLAANPQRAGLRAGEYALELRDTE